MLPHHWDIICCIFSLFLLPLFCSGAAHLPPVLCMLCAFCCLALTALRSLGSCIVSALFCERLFPSHVAFCTELRVYGFLQDEDNRQPVGDGADTTKPNDQVRRPQQKRLNQVVQQRPKWYDTRHKPVPDREGDLVLLSTTNLQVRGTPAKLKCKFVGPFCITECIGSQSYRLELLAT